MRFGRFFVGLALLSSSVAGAMTAMVEVHLGWDRPKPGEELYAKMTIPDADTSELYLVSCRKDGSDLGPGETAIKFAQPVLKGDVPKRIYRLYQERGLAWAIPGQERLGQELDGQSVQRAYFERSEDGSPELWFKFDNQGKQLQRIVPLGFETAGGFAADMTKRPGPKEHVKFERLFGSILSIGHNMMGNQILPFDEVAEGAAIHQTSRRFVAKVTANGANYETMTFPIPFREVRAPKDGKVYLAQENALRAALTQLAASGNRQAPAVDLSRIPAELHEQVRGIAATFNAPVDPIPKVNVAIYAFDEKDLELVDEAKFEAATGEYALVALFVKPWRYTIAAAGQEWIYGSPFGGMKSDLASLPLRAYLAGHFLVTYGVQDAPVDFATLLRLGLVHGDRMQDCAVELGKHSNVKPPSKPNE